MELQDFGPVAQSKEIFTQGVSSKMESDKLIGIALVVLISGVAIGYVYNTPQSLDQRFACIFRRY